MEFSQYFPIWNKLTADQQERLRAVTDLQQIPRGTVVHDGSPECKGLVLVKSGQLRAYLLNDEGREVTICRFFEMDICLFSASCVMPNMMVDVFIEAEKDTEIWVIPACLDQNLMEESRIEESNSLKITHEKIAAHLGTAREVVTRMLRWFQSDGKVKLTRGTVELLDPKGLEELSNG